MDWVLRCLVGVTAYVGAMDQVQQNPQVLETASDGLGGRPQEVTELLTLDLFEHLSA